MALVERTHRGLGQPHRQHDQILLGAKLLAVDVAEEGELPDGARDSVEAEPTGGRDELER